jgi:UDP-galactopyranose mutase
VPGLLGRTAGERIAVGLGTIGAFRPTASAPGRARQEVSAVDFVVPSHLRWEFVFQRPHHLMSRAARDHRVLYVEEPIDADEVGLRPREVLPNLTVVVPTVPPGTPRDDADAAIRDVLHEYIDGWRRDALVVWHYDVMAEPLTRGLEAAVTVYDCMDELSGFLGAPPELIDRERRLFERADLVFTGGFSLYEAKREHHARVYPFPSSVDVAHFRRARRDHPEPAPLQGIGRPRLMYAGVIDERIDLELIADVADAGIGEVVLVGPVLKIDPSTVPAGPNIHALGLQKYEDLPALFAHADVGLMPFALNAATRYISPTKTPEYLAAGLPVVSTAITDVIRGYGDLDRVQIAADSSAFVDACRVALTQSGPSEAVDTRLAGMSWDATWQSMNQLVADAAAAAEAAECVPA